MKTRPIIFTGESVRAILRERDPKTQTRRTRGLEKVPARTTRWLNNLEHDKLTWWPADGADYTGGGIKCPYGQVGDHLWIRETWAVDGPLDQVRREHEDMMPGLGHGPYFRADPVHENTGLTWRSPLHLPRWASRITLEVKDVRAERIQQISEADAKAEGVQPADGTYTADFALHGYVTSYARLWDEIHGKGAWKKNTWCWAITFKRISS